MRLIDLTGRRFGRLVVVRRAIAPRRAVAWECACDCGTTAIVVGADLRDGNTRSCGCLRREVTSERVTTHGKRDTAAYRAWMNMHIRTGRKSGPSWKTYGARGIGVCERWHTFENFYADMGDPPADHSLDRVDNDRGYEPGNCRWATATTQARNRRNVRLITFDGKSQPVDAWSRETGISRNALRSRLAHGWTVERALTEPARH